MGCFPHIFPVFWRQNTGAVTIPGKDKHRFVRFGEPGISDIIGVLNDGKFLAVEVKTPERRKQVSEAQQRFLMGINKAGGVGFVACSIEDIESNLSLYFKKARRKTR